MTEFLWGALAMGSAVVALLFARSWALSRDPLFVWFALAFVVLALNWTALGLLSPSDETRHYLYLPRLLAFGLIIGGIVDKNRRFRRARAGFSRAAASRVAGSR